MRGRSAVLWLTWLALSACAARQVPPAASAESAPQAPVAVPAGPESIAMAVPAAGEEAHRALIAAVACWMGGMWSDAEAASDEDRVTVSKRRCQVLIRRLYQRDDPDLEERTRSLEPMAVAQLRDKILALAKSDGIDATRTQQLVSLLNASADAARETMLARRAADVVKADILATASASKRDADESAAAEPLTKDRAFEQLWRLDVSDLTHEARSIAILNAMDRMNAARGLPKRLKLAALRGPFALLFGVVPADADPGKPLEGGQWLAYLSSAANAAGHPVPQEVTPLPARERLAWGGTVMGLADKLQREAQQLSDATEHKRVALAVVRRLQAAYRASEAAVAKTPNATGLPDDEGLP